MKRKLLSILLTFCLAFSLLPTAALADGEGTQTNDVAQIGSTGYATLAKAVEAATDGTTITLLKDAAVSAMIMLKKSLTLDLNGHKLNDEGNTASWVQVVDNAKLTINGTVEGSAAYGRMNLGIATNNNGSLEINGGIYAVGDEQTVLHINGTCMSSDVTINGATIKATNDNGIQLNGKGAFSITNSEITGGTGIYIKAGTLTLENTKVTGTLTPVNYSYNGNGANATGDAVVIDACNYPGGNPTIAIKSGEFTGSKAAIGYYRHSGSDSAATPGTAAISITGGTFNTDVSAYVADGYILNNGTVEKLGETNAVAKVGNTYYKTLADAVAAADNATVTLLKNTTEDITIASDKTVTLDLAGHKLTNVSGHTITNNGTLFVTGNGTVDNIAHGKGALYNNTGATATLNGGTFTRSAEKGTASPDSANGNSWYTVKNYGTMTINSNVTITNTGSHSSAVANGWFDVSKAGSNGEPIYTTNAVLTINGGNISGGKITVKNDDYGTLTITGGSISQPLNGLYCIYNANVTAISGGNVNGPVGNYNGTSTEADQGKFSITGGYFTSDPSAYLAASHYVWASDKDGYAYMVKDAVPTSPEQKITVIDKTDATVNNDIAVADKAAISGVISKANVDGVAEAVTPAKKADIVSKSNANPGDNDKVEIEVAVKVVAKTADLAKGQLTFEASPVATVKVDGTATGRTVPVTNDMLNGQPITVKLPLPTVGGKLFTPEQIKHISSDGSVEYFLKTAKRGAKTFEIKDDCAVFKITKFSTFELSGTVTYVEPSYSSGSSSSDPTYSVSTPSKTEHGTVTVSPKSASKGDRVTVTVKPDSGYVLETLTVTDKNGNELTLKDKGDGKYTFTMPAGKVEVKATFMEDNSMLNFFYDVPNNAYFYEAVKWAVKNGITTGVGNDLFAPEQPCTRAQIVTFLWRAAGSPEPKGAASGMTDVVSGSYYEKAVAWAIENGITTGTTTSTFSPDATCTRAQAVTFLARALKAKAASAAEFSDVPTGSYFADAVAWAAANGVTEGIGGGLFGSDNDCTRGQIVTFLYRAYNK